MPEPSLFDRRLLVVSGKGGTGKTTVAAACAVASARTGRRTLLAEVEGRDGIPGLLRLPPPGFREAGTPWGFSILSIDPREALVEYLWMFYRIRTLARPLRKARVIEAATETVPGFRDLMVAGKLYEVAEWRRDSPHGASRPQYDLVVVDAPPTGQLVTLLRAATGFRDLLRVGRSNRHLVQIDSMLRTACRVALVATPEEMPVDETAEAIAELEAHGFPPPVVVVNQVLESPFPRGTRPAASRLIPERVAGLIRGAGSAVTAEQAVHLLSSARHQDARHRGQARFVKRLRGLGPTVEIPFVASAEFGPNEVEVIADSLLAAETRGTPAAS